LEALNILRNQELISAEDYEKAKFAIRVKYYKKQVDYYQKIVSDAVAALQDAEIANIEKKYDIEIEAAKGNSEEVK
jgi:hypothetical protein